MNVASLRDLLTLSRAMDNRATDSQAIEAAASTLLNVDLEAPALDLALVLAAVADLVTVVTITIVVAHQDLIKLAKRTISVFHYHSLTSPGAGCSVRTTLSQLSRRRGSYANFN